MIEILINLALLLVLPPILPGIINKTKAFFAGRKGPPVLQPYYDIIKLLKKEMVISKTTTWVFLAGPVIGLVSIFAAGLLVPFVNLSVISFTGDFIFVLALFALARFFTVIAALDTGSPFEGMGASREVTFSTLSEPALFAGMIVLAKISNSLSLTSMVSEQLFQQRYVASIVLLGCGWFIILLAENSRIPFDDPSTHLELTMIHEVMILDHSGPALAIIEYGAAMKMFVLSVLLLQVITPGHFTDYASGYGILIASLFLLAVFVGIVESSIARLRMNNVPKLLVAATIFTIFSFVLLLR